MASATNGKVPHFFIYAKGKTVNQVEPTNWSVVNRLEKIIKMPNLRFEKKTLGKFDYHMLMHNAETEVTDSDTPLIQAFIEISQRCGYRLVEYDNGKNNHDFVYRQIIDELLAIDPDIIHITDVLIVHLFKVQKSKRKSVFWGCFGNIVLDNLRSNIDTSTILCSSCGKRITPNSPRQTMCDECSVKQARIMTRERVRRFRRKTA